MRVRGQESEAKRQVQLFDQMSDQEDILRSELRITITDYSHELQAQMMNQMSAQENSL